MFENNYIDSVNEPFAKSEGAFFYQKDEQSFMNICGYFYLNAYFFEVKMNVHSLF